MRLQICFVTDSLFLFYNWIETFFEHFYAIRKRAEMRVIRIIRQYSKGIDLWSLSNPFSKDPIWSPFFLQQILL